MVQALEHSFDTTPIIPFDISRPPPKIADSDSLIIINATSLGLNNNDPPPISLEGLPSSAKVYDMIYNPPETPFLKLAKTRGMQCENGLSMLVFQAVRSLEIWSKEKVSSESMFTAAQSTL